MATTTDTCPVCGTGTLTIEAESVMSEETGRLVQRITDLLCTRDCDPVRIREELRGRGVNLSV